MDLTSIGHPRLKKTKNGGRTDLRAIGLQVRYYSYESGVIS